MEMNTYLKSVLEGLDEALSLLGYETCNEKDAYIAIDMMMDSQNKMSVFIRKK